MGWTAASWGAELLSARVAASMAVEVAAITLVEVVEVTVSTTLVSTKAAKIPDNGDWKKKK
jgi:hypothetical protein